MRHERARIGARHIVALVARAFAVLTVAGGVVRGAAAVIMLGRRTRRGMALDQARPGVVALLPRIAQRMRPAQRRQEDAEREHGGQQPVQGTGRTDEARHCVMSSKASGRVPRAGSIEPLSDPSAFPRPPWRRRGDVGAARRDADPFLAGNGIDIDATLLDRLDVVESASRDLMERA
ncbi:MAG: hypothetical protein ACYC2G_11280 [Gemmatimonadaceae bacterium]